MHSVAEARRARPSVRLPSGKQQLRSCRAQLLLLWRLEPTVGALLELTELLKELLLWEEGRKPGGKARLFNNSYQVGNF